MGSKAIGLSWEKIKMNEFEIGDIVQLKSGGPKMTIHGLPPEGSRLHYCVWFAGNKIQDGRFDPGVLILVEEEDDQS